MNIWHSITIRKKILKDFEVCVKGALLSVLKLEISKEMGFIHHSSTVQCYKLQAFL